MNTTSKPLGRWGTILSALGLLLTGATAQTTLSLEQALQLAIQNNGTARAAFAERDSAQARLQSTRASLFPSLDVSASSTRTRLEQGGLTSDTTQRQNSLALEWLLLDNGQRNLRVRQSSRSAEATFWNTADTLRTLLFQTARAYFEVLRRQELLQVADETVRRAETLLEAAKAQAEVGTAPAKDVLQAEADLANARVQQIQARNALRLAQADLKRLIGWDSATPLPQLQTVEEPAPVELPPFERLWETAQRQRPDLRSAELATQVARLGVDSARLNSLLRLQVSVSGFREFDPQVRTQGRLQIIASYPLFDGGLTRANLREAEANYESARSRQVQALRDAYAELESAYLSVLESRERLNATQVALAAAQRNYDAAREALNEGVGTIIEVLTAQLALTTAQTNRVQALYDTVVADLQLKRALGERLPQEP